MSYLGRAHGAEVQQRSPSWPMTSVSWGTGKLAPRSLQLSLLPHPASSSAAAAAAAAPARTDKVGQKLIRARNSSSRDLLPSHPLVGSRFSLRSLRSRRALDRGWRRKLIRIKVWCGTTSWASARRAAFGAVRAPCVSAPQTSTQSSDQGDGTARRISMRGAAWLAPGQTERLLGMLKFVQWGNSCSGACVTDSTLCVLYVTRESQL